jgi:hypothetical protein
MQNAFAGYEPPKEQKKACATYWQDKALEAIAYLDNPVKSEVFMWYKCREQKIETAIRLMKEKNIKSFGYLITLMNL